jgi:ribosome-associated toxin RatA of RatAB toxin-antitoxin module
MEVRKSMLVAYSAESMFDLIEAVEHYPAFLPWCAGAVVLSRDESVVIANLSVDYHGLRMGFTTRNPKRRPESMAILLEQGPFRRFEGDWRLTPLAEAACKIEFALSYEFDGAIARTLAGPVFARIADTLINAFVARADSVLRTAQGSNDELSSFPTKGAASDDPQN